MKLKVLVCFVFLLLVFDLNSQNIIRGPYLQVISPNSVMIKWRTDIPTDSKIKWGTQLGNLNQSISDNQATTEHKIVLSSLSLDSKYYYCVGNTNQWLTPEDSTYHFYTWASTTNIDPTRIWVIGDFGKANTGQVNTVKAFKHFNQNRKVDLWLWLGDNAYQNGTDQEYQDKVFSVYTEELKNLPFFSTPGNHDYNSICPIPCTQNPNQHSGTYYDVMEIPQNAELGGVASGTELYYSYDYKNIHFVSINSELGSPIVSGYDWIGTTSSNNANNSPMMQWLKQDLADARARNMEWIIVYFHQPPYSKGSHDSDNPVELYMRAMRKNYLPVLEQYKVDLVLNGHSHVYERSYLLKGFYDDNSSNFNNTHKIDGSSGKLSLNEPYVKEDTTKNGTVYVVCGNSGSSTSNPSLNHPAMYFSHGCSDCYGSLFIEVNGKHLHAKYITSDSLILDEFDILKEPFTRVKNYDNSLSNIKIHPNPFQNELEVTFQLNRKSDLSIDLYNKDGKKITNLYYKKSLKPGSYNEKIQTSHLSLSNGVYLFKFNINGNEKIEKMVKLD